MPVIAIEGLDGSGKTTVARCLARGIGCDMVEKPLQWLLQNDSNAGFARYYEVIDRVNALKDPVPRQWFYCLGWLLIRHRYQASYVVVDRYVLSSLSYNDSEHFDDICALAMSIAGIPFFTVLLEAGVAERKRRIGARSANEAGPSRDDEDAERVERMKVFLQRKGWPHMVLSTDGVAPALVVERVLAVVSRLLTAARS